jgi:hypothetical protein
VKALDTYFLWAAVYLAIVTVTLVTGLSYPNATPDVQFWMRQAGGLVLVAFAVLLVLYGTLRLWILWGELGLRSFFLQIGMALAYAGMVYGGLHFGILGLDQAGGIEPSFKYWWPGIPPQALMWFFGALLFLLLSDLVVFLFHVALFKLSQWRTPGRKQ